MMALDGKPRFDRAQALEVAREIVRYLKPVCERLIVAGSLRRRKQSVGDVEILFIPRFKRVKELRQADLLASETPKFLNLADQELDVVLADQVLTYRKNSLGSNVWGEKNKLARHVASGIAVDFFTATEANWFNYLVCRTGGAENNKQIAMEAQRKGWKWNPYGAGFTDQEGNVVRVRSEEDVFRLVGMRYREPWERS